tara:strand:- start:316 stop:660 length:345 start_codon:yes stop_codon:yes gene_type:complete
MSLNKNIKDLIYFYIKTNYNKYLEDNKISVIEEDKITDVINEIYTERKEHIQVFIKSSLKQLLKDQYPGDQTIQNILLNIFQDEELCKNRIIVEIKLHQQSNKTGKNDYSKLFN